MNMEAQPSSKNEGEEKQVAFEANQARVAEIAEEMKRAIEAGDDDAIATLVAERKSLKAENESVVAEDQQEGIEMNADFDAEKARKAAEAKQQEAEVLSAQAEQARVDAEQTAADQVAAEKLAAEIKSGVKAEGEEDGSQSEVSLASGAEKVSGSAETLPPEVEGIIKIMKAKGYYEDELLNLKPGEAPSLELTTNMTISLIDSSSIKGSLDYAQTLMEQLPVDGEKIKEWVTKRVLENVYSLTDKDIKNMEIAGVDPASLHDKIVGKLSRVLNLLIDGQTGSPENVRKLRSTFNISDDEYVEVLHEYWNENFQKISDKLKFELGFLTDLGGNRGVKTAWEKTN